MEVSCESVRQKESECALRELCLCGQYSFAVNPEEPRDPAIERIQVGTDAAGTKGLSDIPVIFLCLMVPSAVCGVWIRDEMAV